ncbi:hypothetical protein [Methylobacterium soli]|uniref:Uncharacterized protein n=1 Tax=Methylobacterium soli TaxID=553447 RepID=A0A6L3T0D4_9HYPH|nr:hypothetical protein [Methylobacterium soli]KAB1076572.1 hypothetical protein F6X53_23000 [Methylobacterium soli]GJE40973.1 hypothetical protein AEGHOMDF_0132 [Methylobacterium soli]
MRHVLPPRRIPRLIRRAPPSRPVGAKGAVAPARLSDLILALLAVALIGGLALMAAAALMARAVAP